MRQLSLCIRWRWPQNFNHARLFQKLSTHHKTAWMTTSLESCSCDLRFFSFKYPKIENYPIPWNSLFATRFFFFYTVRANCAIRRVQQPLAVTSLMKRANFMSGHQKHLIGHFNEQLPLIIRMVYLHLSCAAICNPTVEVVGKVGMSKYCSRASHTLVLRELFMPAQRESAQVLCLCTSSAACRARTCKSQNIMLNLYLACSSDQLSIYASRVKSFSSIQLVLNIYLRTRAGHPSPRLLVKRLKQQTQAGLCCAL